MATTTKVFFADVADVQYFFGEHSLGPWAAETAQKALGLAPRELFVDLALRLVMLDDEITLVGLLSAGGKPADGVLRAMNLLWAERGF